jgi:tRNA threonylcarbamoyladenosine biosynthesis protein TsaB
MRLLAIETATEACSAALRVDDRVLVRHDVAPRKHAELVLPMVDGLLKEAGIRLADLDALAFGRGPGAFTGVRIAAGVTQGLAFGADRPVIPISTLAALAQATAAEHGAIAVAIDARMGEVYWGLFTVGSDGLVDGAGEERVCKAGDVEVPKGKDWFGVGSGWATYGDLLAKRLGDRLKGFAGDRLPHARDVLALASRELEAGRTVTAAEALPVYLRHPVQGKAWESSGKP